MAGLGGKGLTIAYIEQMTMFHDHSVWSATIMVVGKTFCWNLVQKIQPLDSTNTLEDFNRKWEGIFTIIAPPHL